MPQLLCDPILIETGREVDGRCWAEIPTLPGVMAYGSTPEAAVQAARALAFRVAADLIDAGEPLPVAFAQLFANE